MADRRVVIPYAPRPLQRKIHDSLRRFNVLVCHRRFGKTVLSLNDIIRASLRCDQPRPRYAYIAPLYRQAKQAAWDYLKAYTAPIPGVEHRESDLVVNLPGDRRIQLFGADNPDALRGIYLDGVVLDEYAQMTPRLWTEVIRPALVDRNGYAIFIGTPKGRNAFCELYESARDGALGSDWWAALYRASDTGVVPDSELAAARRDMPEEEYDQEFECSFQAAIRGAYYGKLMAEAESAGRICSVPYDPAAPVHTGWDLGIGDSTAIWFVQQVGRELHWIDYYEASGVGLDHYVKHLQSMPYVWGDHYLPHDVEARELGSGKSRLATLSELGLKGTVVPLANVDDGIHAVRQLLPRSWFDSVKCKVGLECLRQYRASWIEQRNVFAPAPLHDWTSHAADAARTFAMGYRKPETIPEFAAFDRQPDTYDPLRH